MTGAELIAAAAGHGVTVHLPDGPDGERVTVRPCDRLPPELFAAMRAAKAEIRAELRRHAAVAAGWESLRARYVEHGQPVGWLTSDVRMAEHVVSVLWVSSRSKRSDDVLFYRALRRWERVAGAAIREAATPAGADTSEAAP